MSMALADFVVAFPEFANVGNALIQSRLDMAGACLSSEIYGSAYDQALGLKTADLLAASPLGEQARMVIKSGRGTIYGELLDRLTRACTGGYRTI